MSSPEFQPGQRIEFAGDEYIVVENFGTHGIVREPNEPNQRIRFSWVFEGEPCRLLPEPVAPAA